MRSICACMNVVRAKLACGSGGCCAVAVGIWQGLLDEQVRVHLPGGELEIHWQGPGKPLYMTGPATHIYDGQISC